MKLSSRIISKILVLCGISLTCTACYAMPNTKYRSLCDAECEEHKAPSGDETQASREETAIDFTNENE